jgi:ABC-type multidrug transport system fused ATPase/permease subunit
MLYLCGEAGARGGVVNSSGNRSEMSLREQLSELSRGHRVRLAVIIVISFFAGLAEALILLVIARVAFALTREGSDVTISLGPLSDAKVSMWSLIVTAAVLVAVRLVLLAVAVHEQAALGSRVLMSVRNLLVADYLAASWATQAEDRDGRLQELASGFAVSAAMQLNTLATFLGTVFSVVALLATALFANVVGTVVIGVSGVGLVVLLRPFRAALRRRSYRNAVAGIDFATGVSESASMMQEIHVFGTADASRQRLEKLSDASRVANQRFAELGGILSPLFQSMALMIVIGAIALVYAAGNVRLASLGAVVLIGVRALSYGQSVQTAYQQLHAQAPYMSTLKAEHDRYTRSFVPRGTTNLERIDDMVVEGVSYRYDGSGRFALSEVSFSATRGQVVGIVGPSGSGKSTLVQLLLALRVPTGGQILVNGVDQREIDPRVWTQLVTFVPQEPHLYSDTVRENIRFFRSTITDADVEDAARRAHVHEEIVGWPEGYDTQVGEAGRKLSGGQKQRLTIARALAGDPDVVVLDEPTSSLDVKSESVIRATMAQLGRQSIVFVVAHRLSTLDLCDRIMVIQDGELRAFDEPRVLEQSSPFYREALELSGLR